MCWGCCLLVHGLVFHLLMLSSNEQIFLILMNLNILFFSFMVSAFCVLFNLYLDQVQKDILILYFF